MPTELEDLVGFIASPNPQIRAVAIENLVPFSSSEPAIFKANDLLPVRNLKVLVQDRPQIAQHALTILVNLAADGDVLKALASDDRFLDVIFARISSSSEPNADLSAMLLANLAKYDGLEKKILTRKQKVPETLGSNDLVLNQLIDLFVKGADHAYNKDAHYDYLAYFFADLAKHPDVRQYFLRPQEYDAVIPLTKLKAFTQHQSEIRRKGVASTIKNAAFDVPSHPSFFSREEIDIFPSILLPIVGSEEYDPEEIAAMLPELKSLPPDKERESDPTIVQTHVETLMLFTTTRTGRDHMRDIKVYPLIRETHLRLKDEGVRIACERLVQVLMLDDEVEEASAPRVVELDDDEDDDEKVVEV
ncbi:Protein hgh1 [Gnomoniopsis smithogilvyi]|uniref:Protein HGH1 homolog n=1 Tax=Gnomoniopsis smithogilvyi TaxID=1191159 RepID=A0A9W8YSQ6_9PEZI|nr:Protein hgh1 [Gnomoniopsis smithogilvyi]